MVQKLISGNYLLMVFTLVLSSGMNHYFDLENPILIAIFLSFGMFLIYNFQQKGLKFFKSQVGFCTLIFISMLLFYLEINLASLFLLFLNLLVSVVYVYPSTIALRKLPFLKLFLIAACWTTTFVVFPQTLSSNEINWSISIFMYIFFMLLALPFDISHLEQDQGVVQTIPSRFGLHSTQLIMFFLFVCFVYLNVFFSIFSQKNPFYWLLVCQLFISISFISKIKSTFLFFFMFDTLLIIIGLAFYFPR